MSKTKYVFVYIYKSNTGVQVVYGDGRQHAYPFRTILFRKTIEYSSRAVLRKRQ